jgi:hypothetical protein
MAPDLKDILVIKCIYRNETNNVSPIRMPFVGGRVWASNVLGKYLAMMHSISCSMTVARAKCSEIT